MTVGARHAFVQPRTSKSNGGCQNIRNFDWCAPLKSAQSRRRLHDLLIVWEHLLCFCASGRVDKQLWVWFIIWTLASLAAGAPISTQHISMSLYIQSSFSGLPFRVSSNPQIISPVSSWSAFPLHPLTLPWVIVAANECSFLIWCPKYFSLRFLMISTRPGMSLCPNVSFTFSLTYSLVFILPRYIHYSVAFHLKCPNFCLTFIIQYPAFAAIK